MYSFFVRFLRGCFRLLMFFDLKWGRNRSQLSFFRLGSLASSLLIISIWTGQRREGNVLFNDALNTSYLWLYGKISHREYSFRLTARVILYAFVTPVGEHWLE